jgi:hypothetical protein
LEKQSHIEEKQILQIQDFDPISYSFIMFPRPGRHHNMQVTAPSGGCTSLGTRINCLILFRTTRIESSAVTPFQAGGVDYDREQQCTINTVSPWRNPGVIYDIQINIRVSQPYSLTTNGALHKATTNTDTLIMRKNSGPQTYQQIGTT